nr:hypothetical protein [Pseudarthrobacter psychrotolerans]
MVLPVRVSPPGSTVFLDVFMEAARLQRQFGLQHAALVSREQMAHPVLHQRQSEAEPPGVEVGIGHVLLAPVRQGAGGPEPAAEFRQVPRLAGEQVGKRQVGGARPQPGDTGRGMLFRQHLPGRPFTLLMEPPELRAV